MAEKIKKTSKKLSGYGLAFMAFAGVWSFANIVNGFGYFGGTQTIVPWIIVFVLYFLPYSLMVGELGSVFKNTEGGVGQWVASTIGPKIAFLAGWVYWVVHMPYISQKPNSIVIAMNWVFVGDGSVSDYSVLFVQAICMIIFIVGILLSFKGMNIVQKVARLAGIASFVMMILYILMIFAAPALNPYGSTSLRHFNLFEDGIMPDNMGVLMNASVLIFAVGGCEKISPYVKSLKKPGKDFPFGIIMLVVMVIATAIIGSIAINSFYCGQDLPSDFLTNGQYDAFLRLGEFYGVGSLLMIVYALTNSLAYFSAIIISIDAPLRILLNDSNKKFIPKWLYKQNKDGCYTHGVLVVTIIVSILIIIPAFGIGDIDQLVKWLIKLNSVCMPIRYLFVFLAYIALKRNMEKFKNSDYVFIKNKKLGMTVGSWCFFVTLFTIIMGMYSKDPFELAMNCLTPIILCGSGLLIPFFSNKVKIKTKQ